MNDLERENYLKSVKEKLYKKCRTCEHFGPSFSCCLKHKTFTNSRGICDDWEPLNDEELLEYTEKERKWEGFYEF